MTRFSKVVSRAYSSLNADHSADEFINVKLICNKLTFWWVTSGGCFIEKKCGDSGNLECSK